MMEKVIYLVITSYSIHYTKLYEHGSVVSGKTGEVIPFAAQPGSANGGIPSNIYLAGGDKYTGIVRFNLNIR